MRLKVNFAETNRNLQRSTRAVKPAVGLAILLLLLATVALFMLGGCSSPADSASRTPTVAPTETPQPPTPTATRVSPTSTATAVTPSPTSTYTPSPTPTASPSPTPTPTVDHFGANGIDQRFGVVTTSPGHAWQLSELQVDWYLDYSNTVTDIPTGKNKLLYIRMYAGDPRLSPETIRNRAESYPGAVWYLGGEPNVPGGGRYTHITPEEYIPEFEYYRQQIKAADPTALITGPSILNWDFTCRGCGGYMSGEEWTRDFVDRYVAQYGIPPRVDIWTIDSYPLTWDSLPMIEWRIVAEQIEHFRQYLVEEVSGHAETPIWITELATHWAYEELGVNDWEGEYEWDAMEGYVTNLIGWLRNNSDRLGVEKWFFYRASITPGQHSASNPYAGIYFLDAPGSGAALNKLGRVYRDMATGIK